MIHLVNSCELIGYISSLLFGLRVTISSKFNGLDLQHSRSKIAGSVFEQQLNHSDNTLGAARERAPSVCTVSKIYILNFCLSGSYLNSFRTSRISSLQEWRHPCMKAPISNSHLSWIFIREGKHFISRRAETFLLCFLVFSFWTGCFCCEMSGCFISKSVVVWQLENEERRQWALFPGWLSGCVKSVTSRWHTRVAGPSSRKSLSVFSSVTFE